MIDGPMRARSSGCLDQDSIDSKTVLSSREVTVNQLFWVCMWRLLGVILIGATAGCGGQPTPPTPPFKTYTLKGKVVYKDGRGVEQLERGRVWFQSRADANIKAVGGIGDDGTFTMTVLVEDKSYAGVPEGEYKVRVEPPLDDERKPRRRLIHPRHLDYETSGLRVTVPSSNEISLALDRPG
jgi:hypothetical protein